MDALQVKISGIKCDNKKCDFADKSVPFEEYKDWLNKPCPKCEHNLLTEKDYNIAVSIVKFVQFVSSKLPKIKKSTTLFSVKLPWKHKS
jgi:hypothetical protein